MGQKNNKNTRLAITLIILSFLINESHQQFLNNFLTSVMSSSPPKEKEQNKNIETLETILQSEENSGNTIHDFVPIPKDWNPLLWLNSKSKVEEDENYNPDTDLTTVFVFFC